MYKNVTNHKKSVIIMIFNVQEEESMKLISLRCPNCNANLTNIDSSLKQCFCQYCGTKIVLDENIIRKETHIYDEAKIKETESKEAIHLKELEIEKGIRKQKIIIGSVLLIGAVILVIVGMMMGQSINASMVKFMGYMLGIVAVVDLVSANDREKK